MTRLNVARGAGEFPNGSGVQAHVSAEEKRIALKARPEPPGLEPSAWARTDGATPELALGSYDPAVWKRAARCSRAGLGKADISDFLHIASGLFAGLRGGDPPDPGGLKGRFPYRIDGGQPGHLQGGNDPFRPRE